MFGPLKFTLTNAIELTEKGVIEQYTMLFNAGYSRIDLALLDIREKDKFIEELKGNTHELQGKLNYAREEASQAKKVYDTQLTRFRTEIERLSSELRQVSEKLTLKEDQNANLRAQIIGDTERARTEKQRMETRQQDAADTITSLRARVTEAERILTEMHLLKHLDLSDIAGVVNADTDTAPEVTIPAIVRRDTNFGKWVDDIYHPNSLVLKSSERNQATTGIIGSISRSIDLICAYNKSNNQLSYWFKIRLPHGAYTDIYIGVNSTYLTNYKTKLEAAESFFKK